MTTVSPSLRRRSSDGDPEQVSALGARPERSGSARRALLGLAIAFLALSLLATLSSEPGRYVADARLEHVTAPDQYLARHAHLWDDQRSLGKPASHFSPVVGSFQAAVAATGAKPWLIERITHSLYLTLAAFGVILLLRAFRPRIGLEHVIAGFVYTFSPFTSQFLLPSGLFLAYALAPWFAWIALHGVRGHDPWRWAAAFALGIAAYGALNAASLGFALIPAALTAIYVSLRERGGVAPLCSWAWRSGLLTALTCSAAIVVVVSSAPDISANLRNTELPETVARTSSWFESWRGLGNWLTYFREPGPVLDLLRPEAVPYFTVPAVIAASFLAPIGALVALGVGRWRHRLLFGSMLFVSLVLMVGMHGVAGPSPFGQVLSFAFDHSELARGFRATYKAGPGLMLGTAVLLGIGLGAMLRWARRGPAGKPPGQPGRPPRRRLMIRVGIVLVASSLLVASFPFWTGRLYGHEYSFRSIPKYWAQAFEHLEAQGQPGRVLVLPGGSRARYRWGHVNDNLFEGLSPLSPVMNQTLPQGTAESADLVAAVDEYVSSNEYIRGTLAPILARLGVRWVLLQNDLNWQRMQVPRPSTFDRLRTDPGLDLAATFGRPGLHTADPRDLDADLLGERSLPPVELYEVDGQPSPRPRLMTGPPLLVEGAGDSWPALAAAGLLDGPPVAYAGAAPDATLRQLVTSGADVVVTDGNRRRATQATTGRPRPSSTLARGQLGFAGRPASQPGDALFREPADLFGDPGTQSLATYADAVSIAASQYGDHLPYGGASPALAFDGVERTAWLLPWLLNPAGESLTVELRKPMAVTAVSVLPRVEGDLRLKTVDVIARSEDGSRSRTRLRFAAMPPERARGRIDVADVNAIELSIAGVEGGAGSVGIAEVEVMTPDGPLDLREFVRVPEDLATRAATDERLGDALAARPPRYELRRIGGIGDEEEETELRREIFAFGDHRYELGVTARIDDRAADTAIDALLGARVGAAGTSRFAGDLERRGALVVDDDLSTAWEPVPRVGERVDLRFPRTEVRTVEVRVASRASEGAERSRATDIEVSVGDQTVESTLPGSPRCARPEPPTGRCLETHRVRVAPERTGNLSVALTGIDPVVGLFGELPPSVVEVRINGRDWSELGGSSSRGSCVPLVGIDGRPVGVRLPSDPGDALAGRGLELTGCRPIRLGPGLHRIETLPGLSGSALTVSLVPGDHEGGRRELGEPGAVELVDRSPTRLELFLDAPEGGLLIGGMPRHDGWAADRDELAPSPVSLDTFGAWRLETPVAGPVTLGFEPQRIYELALALSIAAAAWCLWRMTRRPRGRAR